MSVPGKISVALVAAGILFATPTSAWADSEQPLPGTQANGIKMGDARLHVYVDLESDYDSGAWYSSTPPQGSPPNKNNLYPELVGHLRPGVRLDMPGSWLDLGFNGDVDFVGYSGLLSKGDTSASRVEAAMGLNAAVNRSGAVELDVTDTFSRSDRPHDPTLGLGVLSLYNLVGLAAPIHPGGHALEITPGISFSFEDFTPLVGASSDALQALNYENVQAGLTARYRFLPKTAILLEGTLDDRSYAVASQPKALLLRAQGGLAGLLTSRISIVAKAGWAVDLDQSRASTVIGQLEGTYLLNETTTLKAGFLRTVEPTSTYGTFEDSRPYVEARALFFGRLTAHATAGFDLLDFNATQGSTSGREDHLWTGDVGPEYQVASWFIVAAGCSFGIRTSSGSSSTLSSPGSATETLLDYQRIVGYLRFTFTY